MFIQKQREPKCPYLMKCGEIISLLMLRKQKNHRHLQNQRGQQLAKWLQESWQRSQNLHNQKCSHQTRANFSWKHLFCIVGGCSPCLTRNDGTRCYLDMLDEKQMDYKHGSEPLQDSQSNWSGTAGWEDKFAERCWESAGCGARVTPGSVGEHDTDREKALRLRTWAFTRTNEEKLALLHLTSEVLSTAKGHIYSLHVTIKG